MDKKKIILYFGLAGALPVIFFRTKEIIEGSAAPMGELSNGTVVEFDLAYLVAIIVNLMVSYGVTAFVSSAVLLLPVSWLEKNLPWEKSIWKRFFAEIFASSVTASAAMYVAFNILLWTNLVTASVGEYLNKLQDYIEIGLVMNLLLVTLYEGIVLFRKWKLSLVQSERLEKENMITRYEALKNQVNPHFLFNSLNTLSSLIHEDVRKSEEFIDEFSAIYRYILEKQDKMVASVEDEINFIKSFLALQKIRFGEALKTSYKIDQDKLDCFIPTLALQLLVENAIKHNRVTRDEPLTIGIQTNGQFLTITNNYQPRKDQIKSTGIGLKNLNERYAILCDELRPDFYVNDEEYVARLPLIEME